MPQSAPKQFSGIFLCYRRDDSSGHAGRLFDKLSDHFDKERIFMDVDTIEPGEDFVQVIENAIGSCEILIAIIGRQWLSGAGETGRWLDNPNDYVRVEIAAALSRDIRVIPVLVQRASMPKPEDLPDDLTKLSRRNAVELSDLRWQHDVDQLISVMERVLVKREEAVQVAEAAKQSEEERHRREDEEKRRSEEEKQLRLAEEEAKQRAAAERRREEGERERREAEERVRKKAEEAEGRRREAEEVERCAAEGENGKKEPPKKFKLALVITGAALLLFMVGVALIMWWKQAPAGQHLIKRPDMTNRIGMEFMWIPPGNFLMGTDNGRGNEKPVHQVTISEGFFMSRYEVPQAQWQKLMTNNPSFHIGDNVAVDAMSWDDAVAFIARLNAQNDGYVYRLPSEAEWEYGARAGTTGDHAGDVDAIAWYDKNSGNQTHPVGSKLPNAFGLFDMQGNVWEWCQDGYHGTYAGAPTDGSAWVSAGEQQYRVMRGGSWNDPAVILRPTLRHWATARDRVGAVGLRVVAVVRK